MSQTQENVVLALPREPKIDQLCALFVRMIGLFGFRVLTGSFAEVVANVRFVFRDTEDAELPAGAASVDWNPYHVGGFGSATEEQGNLLFQKVGSKPAVAHLVSLLNSNNQSGTLRKSKDSLATLLRRVYELDRGSFRSLWGDPQTKQDFTTFRVRVIALFWPLLQLYFHASETDLEAVKAIDNPFSFAGMREMLEIIGDEADEGGIEESLRHAESLVKARMKRAEEKAQTAVDGAKKFEIARQGGGKIRCLSIETDDRLVPAQVLKQNRLGVLVVRRTDTKQYSVFCTGRQNFSALRAALVAKEGDGVWYLEDKPPQSPMLLNGSASRAAKPSQLKPAEVIALVEEHVKYVAS